MGMLETIFDNIDESIIIIGADRKILMHNREADRIYSNISNSSLRPGLDLVQVAIPERKKIVKEILEQVDNQKEPYRTFVEYRTMTGTKLFVDMNFVPVLDDDDNISYILIIAQDVTPQKIFEQKMTAVVSEVTNLIDHVNVIITSTDSRGYITQWNNLCTEVFGYEKSEVFTRKIDFLIAPEHYSKFDAHFKKALQNEVAENVEIPFRTRDGRDVIIMLTATPRLSADRRVTGVTFAGQDITELTRYRTSLEKTVEERTLALRNAIQKEKEALEIKSRFVAMASHEFRTPLSAIEHTTGLIRSRHHELTKDELHAKLDYIEKHRTHMTHLLDDVLTYGKSEPGKIKLFVTALQLGPFVDKIMEEVIISTKKTHSIRLKMIDAPDEISTDEKLFRNVVINLLTNAIKFSPNASHVDLTITGLADKVRFQIRDRGIGIPAEELEKIFEPFLRGKAVHNIPGTGLGLSIVKKSVGMLQGDVDVTSEPGNGSTFSVTIPAHLSETP